MNHWLWTALGGGGMLALQAFWRLIIGDVASRITATMWGIRSFDAFTGWLIREPVWSGAWQVHWKVQSQNFAADNIETGRMYRCFKSVALEGVGTTATGLSIPYAFLGKLSRDNSIVTGTWFDRRGSSSGYHGAFQLRLKGTGDAAAGLWIGFSETSALIKSDDLEWTRVGD